MENNSKLDFSAQDFYVGLDIHKKELDSEYFRQRLWAHIVEAKLRQI